MQQVLSSFRVVLFRRISHLLFFFLPVNHLLHEVGFLQGVYFICQILNFQHTRSDHSGVPFRPLWCSRHFLRFWLCPDLASRRICIFPTLWLFSPASARPSESSLLNLKWWFWSNPLFLRRWKWVFGCELHGSQPRCHFHQFSLQIEVIVSSGWLGNVNTFFWSRLCLHSL